MRRSPGGRAARLRYSPVPLGHGIGRRARWAPQGLIITTPVADPGTLPRAAVVHRPLHEEQIGHPSLALGPLVGGHPDALPVREHLARAVRADTSAGPVPQLLGAGLRAG